MAHAFGSIGQGGGDSGGEAPVCTNATCPDMAMLGLTDAELAELNVVGALASVDLPSLPQGMVDAVAGFGDVLSFGGTAALREMLGHNYTVNFGSMSYYGGAAAGTAVHVIGFRRGAELSIGRNFRLAPWGNRTGHRYGKYPHYHRRGVGPNGQTRPGQGIGRHRPGETKSTDMSFWDRF